VSALGRTREEGVAEGALWRLWRPPYGELLQVRQAYTPGYRPLGLLKALSASRVYGRALERKDSETVRETALRICRKKPLSAVGH
jgi:hypothetical protein